MREPKTSERPGGALRFLAGSLLLLSAACGGKATDGATKTLVFSAIPDDNKTELKARYDKIASYLSEKLDVKVEYHPTSDYGASVEAFKAGDVQLAWFGGVTGVQARQAVSGAKAIAQGVVDPNYKSYFIANPASGITASESFPSAMKGKSFTFGSERSTSGRVMPEFFIREATGQSPEEFFGHPNRYSGSHDITAQQVQDGTADCGALSYKTYDRLVANGKIDATKCAIVWTTPTYADYNWTAHPDLEKHFGEGFIDRLQTVLVGIKDPELLKALDRSEGLITAKNADFDAIANTMKDMGMLR